MFHIINPNTQFEIPILIPDLIPKSRTQHKIKRNSRQKAIHTALTLLRPISGGGGIGRWHVPALLAPRHHQNRAAGGARRVGTQPRVDARHMEGVAALGQHPDLLAGGELR
ncbi:membrane-associated protein TcaA [Striga asiatica]|uniref:Membrane-associated protein TcaA n=1 Tax=Striga asiatica TaxID=4170 RepID=A0A5A7P9M2_STRAF|nr:membrane-associated protein TcaA [Striga asiatica]